MHFSTCKKNDILDKLGTKGCKQQGSSVFVCVCVGGGGGGVHGLSRMIHLSSCIQKLHRLASLNLKEFTSCVEGGVEKTPYSKIGPSCQWLVLENYGKSISIEGINLQSSFISQKT